MTETRHVDVSCVRCGNRFVTVQTEHIRAEIVVRNWLCLDCHRTPAQLLDESLRRADAVLRRVEEIS